MKMSVSQVVVRFLKDAGVRYVFGVSGHSIFDLTDAIYSEPDIDFAPAQIEIASSRQSQKQWTVAFTAFCTCPRE